MKFHEICKLLKSLFTVVRTLEDGIRILLLQRNLDQTKTIYLCLIQIALQQKNSFNCPIRNGMSSGKAMAFLIVLMRFRMLKCWRSRLGSFLLASGQRPVICESESSQAWTFSTSKMGRSTDPGRIFLWFFRMFSDVLGRLGFHSKLKLSEAISDFAVPGSQSFRTCNHSEDCDRAFLELSNASCLPDDHRQAWTWGFLSLKSWELQTD